tara:strand:- start:4615 stop:4791 length:177 start_codon:yes stop_codon:yes gene_type:complete
MTIEAGTLVLRIMGLDKIYGIVLDKPREGHIEYDIVWFLDDNRWCFRIPPWDFEVISE